MKSSFVAHLSVELDSLKSAGLYKSVRVISSMQSAEVEVAAQREHGMVASCALKVVLASVVSSTA